MSTWQKVSLCLVLGIVFCVISCARHPTFAYQDAGPLAEIARTYGQGSRQPSLKLIAQSQTTVAADIGDAEAEYKPKIAAFLVLKDYDALEREAADARTRKTRFSGGVWKLFSFYDALSDPVAGPLASDADWKFHIANLTSWGSARPESVTAQVAFAEAYIEYAFKARGSGYSNSVSEGGWKVFQERVALAASALTQAGKLKEKCPHWYDVMQQVALVQGWDKPQARKLFEEAIVFEPTYYHYYREYANYLLPKWYGEPGETEAFADEVYKRVGGQQGSFLYFEIASQVTCQCDSSDSHMENLSWPKIKEGYAALGQLYGYSSLKMNRFAHMAFEAQDKPAAQQVFVLIGTDWNHRVWASSLAFDNAKTWAESQ
jgi:hypothetical protein